MPSATAKEEKRKKRKLKESLLEEQVALLTDQNALLIEQLRKHSELLEEHRKLIEEQRGVGGTETSLSLPKPEAGGPKAKQRKRKRKSTEASPPEPETKRKKRKKTEPSPDQPNKNEELCARSAILISTVALKAWYDKEEVGPPRGSHAERAQRIRELRESFREFGFEKPEEVDQLADLVS